ncbi:MAG: hypothetical protein WKF70_14410, partial [Chitinophagaceae bacterium]
MKYFFFSILFFCLSNGYAQKSRLLTSVDKRKILIGEPFELTIKAFVSGAEIAWPTTDSIPHFEILSKGKIDSQLNNGTLILNQVITLTAWDSGRWTIPSYAAKGSTPAAPLLINVLFTPLDTTQDYHDVRDIMDGAKAERSQWYWYVVGALLLAGLLALLFPGRKAKKEATSFVPDTDIYQQSLKRLSVLQKNGANSGDELYQELTDILRTYLHKRKGIALHSQTTDDLAEYMSHAGLPPLVHESLLKSLRLSDLVKFARWQPAAGQNETSI